MPDFGLSCRAKTSPQVEIGSSPPAGDRRQVVRRRHGDGILAPIGRWQEENQLPPTTFLTSTQYARLKLDTDEALKNYRAQRASEAEAKKQESATSQKAEKAQPTGRAKPRRQQQREAANPRPVPKSQAIRKSGFRTCSGIDGTFEVPASQRCPLSGYAHY